MPLKDVKLLILDVDGVLTDGSIFIDESGRETKRFHVRDGLGITAWLQCGYEIAILSSRISRAVTHRATELGIQRIEQGVAEKHIGLENLCRNVGVDAEEVAYLGDDLADLPALCRVGYLMAVADAAPEVQQVASFITGRPGGSGAVREAVEHMLHELGRWDEVLEHYGL